MSARRAAAAVVVIAILAPRAAWSAPPASAPPAASSDEIAADALFEEAKRLMSERSYDAACEKFAASNRLCYYSTSGFCICARRNPREF